jgi:hypothetical protein
MRCEVWIENHEAYLATGATTVNLTWADLAQLSKKCANAPSVEAGAVIGQTFAVRECGSNDVDARAVLGFWGAFCARLGAVGTANYLRSLLRTGN